MPRTGWTYREPPIYVKDVLGRGRGVFADEPIIGGSELVCPVWVLPYARAARAFHKLVDARTHEPLTEFTFGWCGGRLALPMGWASFLNHPIEGEEPNLDYTKNDFRRKVLVFEANRDIRQHEQLTFFYQDGTRFD